MDSTKEYEAGSRKFHHTLGKLALGSHPLCSRPPLEIDTEHEPRLMAVAFVLSQLAALPDALLALWLMLLGKGVLEHRPGMIQGAAEKDRKKCEAKQRAAEGRRHEEKRATGRKNGDCAALGLS